MGARRTDIELPLDRGAARSPPSPCGRRKSGGPERCRRTRRVVISRGEYGVKNGRRRDSRAGEATGPSSPLRRCGHRTRCDLCRGRRLCVGDSVDSGPRRAARGKGCCGFDARHTRIAAQQQRRRATPAAASLCAAGWNSDLSQFAWARRHFLDGFALGTADLCGRTVRVGRFDS